MSLMILEKYCCYYHCCNFNITNSIGSFCKKVSSKGLIVYPFIVNLLCVTCLHSVSFAMYWFSYNDVNVEGLICDVESVLMVLTCQSQEIWVIYHSYLLSSCCKYETWQFFAASFVIMNFHRFRVFNPFNFTNYSI